MWWFIPLRHYSVCCRLCPLHLMSTCRPAYVYSAHSALSMCRPTCFPLGAIPCHSIRVGAGLVVIILTVCSDPVAITIDTCMLSASTGVFLCNCQCNLRHFVLCSADNVAKMYLLTQSHKIFGYSHLFTLRSTDDKNKHSETTLIPSFAANTILSMTTNSFYQCQILRYLCYRAL